MTTQHPFTSLRGNLSKKIEADMPPSTTCSHRALPRQQKKSLKTVSQTENGRRAEEGYNVMKSSIKRVHCSTYGEHVGNELRKLSAKSQIYVKHMINNVIFKTHEA
ncbi:unnamed protein product [Pieris brassicae]|uniref:Uncharacterized protein n=1 Tax=Pieris brassicae TaxID=7116 RepID=A0A9P0TEV8_PIEBR|nr:unnamed protein product [Pieris brassicae]